MNKPSSAREALLAEALGDMVAILARAEAVEPALQAACDSVSEATKNLVEQAGAMEGRVKAVTELATLQAIKHVARRTDELARAAAQVETRAMQETARSLLRAEVTPAIQRLVQSVEQLRAHRTRWRASWWAHAGTGLAASLLTWLLLTQVSV